MGGEKSDDRDEAIGVRLDADALSRLERLVGPRRRSRASRAEVLREALLRGLELMEREATRRKRRH